MSIKSKVYNFIVRTGLKILGKAFPSVHYAQPLKPSDRFLEYPFVFSHLPKDKTILDVGCSGSFFPLICASLGYSITGCDLRPYDILNNLNFKNFTFLRQDIRTIYGSFDVVTCISVLEHIGLGRYGETEDSDADIEMVDKINDLLNPKGIVLITVPYGKAEVFKPYHRIYDLARIRRITEKFNVKTAKFYTLDKNGDWIYCNADEGELIRGGVGHYGLALLCLEKK